MYTKLKMIKESSKQSKTPTIIFNVVFYLQ